MNPSWPALGRGSLEGNPSACGTVLIFSSWPIFVLATTGQLPHILACIQCAHRSAVRDAQPDISMWILTFIILWLSSAFLLPRPYSLDWKKLSSVSFFFCSLFTDKVLFFIFVMGWAFLWNGKMCRKSSHEHMSRSSSQGQAPVILPVYALWGPPVISTHLAAYPLVVQLLFTITGCRWTLGEGWQ